MGDDPAPSASETTGEMLKAFTEFLPALMKTVNAQLLPSELAKLDTSRVTSPGFAQLNLDMSEEFLPQLNELGSQIAIDNQRRQAEGEAAVLGGAGRDVVERGMELERLADPEFFAIREQMGDQFSDLLNGGLTGGENAEIERAVAQDRGRLGLGGVNTGTGTVQAAQQFGKAAGDKLRNTIAQATQFLQQSRTGIDPFLEATGRSARANVGNSNFMGAQTNVGQNAVALGSQFLGETGQNARQTNEINANRTTGIDRAISGISAAGSLMP